MSAFEDWADVLTYAVFVALPLLSGAILLWLVRSARRRGKPPSVLLANLITSVFLVVALLAAFESYYRFFCDATDSYLLSRTTQRWFDRHWLLNVEGVRDNVGAYPLLRTPGKRRITFIGDSFTAGHGVANVDDRFANRIRKAGQDEVHVFANLGDDTGNEIKVVQDLIARHYQFDEVVLVYILNDISDICPEREASVHRIFSRKPPGFLIRHSFLFNSLYYRLKSRFDPDMSNYYQYVRSHYDDSVWEWQKERLKQLRDLVEGHGGHLLVVTFPFLHHLGPGYEYRPVHARLAAFWREQGIPHLDLLPVFEAHLDHTLVVNAHDAHPNVFAHTLAAEAIDEFVQQNRRKDSRP